MNLAKISKALDRYVQQTYHERIPDVKELYDTLGADVMGRVIYEFSQAKHDQEYFNKPVIHKSDRN